MKCFYENVYAINRLVLYTLFTSKTQKVLQNPENTKSPPAIIIHENEYIKVIYK